MATRPSTAFQTGEFQKPFIPSWLLLFHGRANQETPQHPTMPPASVCDSGGRGPAAARRTSPSSADDLLQLPEGSVPGNDDAAWEKKPTAASRPEAGAAGAKKPIAASQPETGGKKPAFSRVWSEADDVRILEALAAHVEVHGAPPGRSQLRGALAGRAMDKAEFTVTEIYEKVRRLRTKYWNMRSAGVPPVPASGGDDGDDDIRKYEFSMLIWGNQPAPGPTQPKVPKKGGSTSASAAPKVANKVGSTSTSTSTNAVPSTRVRRGFEDLRCLYPNLTVAVEGIVSDMNEDMLGAVLKRTFELISDEEAGELDAKVKKQRVLEAKMTKSRATMRNEVLGTLIRSMD
ncbi:uncharacterized protein LOC133901227 [Phragmites australis]|uniref:uncharacterized protein LOC133901227 n=1 Tax=Phragmites australis TaxID=29695 RepID=UPI002D79A307|nr:uncharacterized protein LOC133901227 [Phragmites australis]